MQIQTQLENRTNLVHHIYRLRILYIKVIYMQGEFPSSNRFTCKLFLIYVACPITRGEGEKSNILRVGMALFLNFFLNCHT